MCVYSITWPCLPSPISPPLSFSIPMCFSYLHIFSYVVCWFSVYMYLCLCLYISGFVCNSAPMGVRVQLIVSSLLYHLGSGNQTQVVRLGRKYLYPLNHLTISYLFIYSFCNSLNPVYAVCWTVGLILGW